jgi:hypothetical protein
MPVKILVVDKKNNKIIEKVWTIVIELILKEQIVQ